MNYVASDGRICLLFDLDGERLIPTMMKKKYDDDGCVAAVRMGAASQASHTSILIESFFFLVPHARHQTTKLNSHILGTEGRWTVNEKIWNSVCRLSPALVDAMKSNASVCGSW